ncbi:MAG TPA: LysR family transcriptional regulator [Burkholderiales bacterium]|nr:LysR family transcriptional regulator [Burkholderiales bacterium]
MKASLQPGLTKTQTVVVDVARATRHMGEHLGVYATPAMVNDIEMLCRNFLREHVDPGEDSVGTRVDIHHLAATPEGMSVEITVKILAVDRRAVTFEAVVRDAIDEVGRCTHHRFIVDLEKLKERLEAKIAKTRR